MSEERKDIIENVKIQDVSTHHNKSETKSLEQFVVSVLQTNKTMFCIALAFSIFLYFQPVRIPFSHHFTQDGLPMTFECLSKKINGYSTFLLITEIFLTAFSITRFLQMINIVDIIMRMPFVCDLIFWLRYEDRVAMRWITENKKQNPYLDEILSNTITDGDNKCYKIDLIMPYYRVPYIDQEFGSFMRYVARYKILHEVELENSCTLIQYSYPLLRQITIHQKGYFYEKSLYKLIKKHKKLTAIILTAILFFSFFSYVYKCFL